MPRLELTQREIDSLIGLACGLMTEGIGMRHGISPNTVKQHLAHAYEKLGAVNGPHAVAIAIYRGLINKGEACMNDHQPIAGQLTRKTLPAGTVVHVEGVPLRLVTDVEVESPHGNFALIEQFKDQP